MRDEVKKDILALLKEVKQAFREKDSAKMEELSNHVIHDASIFQDEDSLTLAVLVHALAKVVQQCCDKGVELPKIMGDLKRAEAALVKDDLRTYRNAIQVQMRVVRKYDKKTRIYMQEVFDRVKVKKASKLHEHGLSLRRTAELLGVPQWELQKYQGNVHVSVLYGLPVEERLRAARKLFQ